MKWELSEQKDHKLALLLAEKLDMPSIITQILINRGMRTEDDIKGFFHPSLDNLHNPLDIPGMDTAVERVVSALRDRERIIIFGDYDVDGLTSTALIYDVLTSFGGDVGWYLPDRLEEGYGLNREGIRKAREQNASLLISVDCGITGVEEVLYANSLGMDCVITDHPEPGHSIPKAYAVVDPKLITEDSDLRDLAGVGVAFKLAQALYEHIGVDKRELFSHLDLVGLGTIDDIVPLVGENRILAKFGLRTLEATQKPGLKELLRITNLWGSELSSWHVVFVLAPRLNAVGRIGDPSLAFKLLTTLDPVEAHENALMLDTQNEKRKELDERIFDEAIKMVERQVDLKREKAIVLDSSEWHTGVIGIVASRLVEKFNRPSIMISTQDGDGKGSARSINNFHILDAIKDSEMHLLKYGGHKYAAGLSIRPDQIADFRKRFYEYTSRHLTTEDLVPKIEIDAQVFPEEIDLDLMEWLNMFAPYGPGNMRPIFVLEDAQIVGFPQIVGSDHLRMQIRTKNRHTVDVIGFSMARFRKPIMETTDRAVNLCFVLETNSYYGYPKLQLRLRDIVVGDWRT